MVKTVVLEVNSKKPDEKAIEKAVTVIKNGGLVIYPTETCYGIGADAANERAIRRLRKIKRRFAKKPILIIVPDISMMKKYGVITKKVMLLIKKFMPGPLTIVVNKKNTVPKILNPKEIAFRIPSNQIAYKLVNSFRKPITSTSANISGQTSLYKIKDVIETFYGKVDFILDAGDLKRVKPSTVIDMKDKPVMIRKGPISEKTILNKLKEFKKIKSRRR